MPILAGQLVQDQKLVSVSPEESLTHALTLMIEHDFSQLPIVSPENKPLGIVTCASIAKALLHLGAKVEDILVNHALVKLHAYQADEDLLYLLDTILKDAAVFVVSSDGILLGIITEFDTTQYFRQRAEDLVLINDIEDALKRHLQIAYDAEEQESKALRDAIDNLNNSLDGIRKKSHSSLKALCKEKSITATPAELEKIVDKHFPLREDALAFDDLSLSDFIQLAQKNWARLQPVFNISQQSWSQMMGNVRLIRNKLFHFKGDTSAVERNRLQFCANWYVNHPAPTTRQAGTLDGPPVNTVDTPPLNQQPTWEQSQPAGETTESKFLFALVDKYKPIIETLDRYRHIPEKEEVPFNLDYFDGAVSGGLPKAAKEHLSWWTRPSSYSRQWLQIGWRATALDSGSGKITFKRLEKPDLEKPINPEDPWEVGYWCQKFGCNEQRLVAGVAATSGIPAQVAEYLKKSQDPYNRIKETMIQILN